MKKKSSQSGLKRVIAEEKARGRRGSLPDEEVLRKKRQAKNDFNTLMERGNRKEFIKWLKDYYGIEPDSEHYQNAVAAWDEEVKRRRQGYP